MAKEIRAKYEIVMGIEVIQPRNRLRCGGFLFNITLKTLKTKRILSPLQLDKTVRLQQPLRIRQELDTGKRKLIN